MAYDWLRYANQGAVRNQPLSDRLTGALGFLPDLGVSMEVFSGGQPDLIGPGVAARGRCAADRVRDHAAADVVAADGGEDRQVSSRATLKRLSVANLFRQKLIRSFRLKMV